VGYGALIVGHPVDLNRAPREHWSYLPDDLSGTLSGASGLRLYGGERQPWRRAAAPFAPAFVGRAASVVREEIHGSASRLVTEAERRKLATWLDRGFPRLSEAQAHLDELYPGLVIAPERGLFLVLSGVSATTSTELISGGAGTLSYEAGVGWDLRMHCAHTLDLALINRGLKTERYSLSMGAYRADSIQLGEDPDDDSAFDEFVIQRKFSVIKLLCELGFEEANLYDEHTTSWTVLYGQQVASVYKDTHCALSQLPSGALHHRTRHTG